MKTRTSRTRGKEAVLRLLDQHHQQTAALKEALEVPLREVLSDFLESHPLIERVTWRVDAGCITFADSVSLASKEWEFDPWSLRMLDPDLFSALGDTGRLLEDIVHDLYRRSVGSDGELVLTRRGLFARDLERDNDFHPDWTILVSLSGSVASISNSEPGWFYGPLEQL